MSKIFFGILAGLIVGASATWTFLKHHDAAEKKEEPKEASRVVHTNDQTFLKLDAKGQEHAGLRVAALEAATLKPEVKAYGRVLDPAPLVAAVSELASARLALEISMKDFDRLKVLHAQDQNVSTRVLDMARRKRPDRGAAGEAAEEGCLPEVLAGTEPCEDHLGAVLPSHGLRLA